MFSAKEIFEIAIKLERNGEQLYREALEYVSEPALRETLAWLADQEKRHRDLFTEMKDAVKPGSNDFWAEQLSSAILHGAVQHHAFSLEDVDFKSIANETELINVAVEFEKDGVMFYQIIRSFVTDSDALIHLDEIIDEEHKHIKALEDRKHKTEQPRETR